MTSVDCLYNLTNWWQASHCRRSLACNQLPVQIGSKVEGRRPQQGISRPAHWKVCKLDWTALKQMAAICESKCAG